jgi:predicted metal-dependent RNase
MYQNKRSPFQSKYLTPVESFTLGSEPAIIICPLSTKNEEPLLHYLKQLSQRQESKIILTSYQMPGSLGSYIQEGSKQILLGGQEIQIRCIVEKIEGLDIHSDYSQLMSYVGKLRQKLRRVLVNHGERPKVQNLATSINRILKVQTQHPSVLEAIKLV